MNCVNCGGKGWRMIGLGGDSEQCGTCDGSGFIAEPNDLMSKPAGKRAYPDLLSEDEQQALLTRAERLWRDLQANNLGGFSGGNRPFYILHEFRQVIEEFGRRDVGLKWSKNDLDAARAESE